MYFCNTSKETDILMLKKVKLSLRDLNTELKIQKTRKIISCIQNHVMFPQPDPSLSEIEKLAGLIEVKSAEIAGEKNLLHRKTTQLALMEADLDKKLTLLAAYVESKAKGDVEIIKSAGMDTRADSVPLGTPGQVSIKQVRETMNYGELKLKWEKVRGAKVYNVEFNNKPSSEWALYDSTTKTKILVNHLKSGKRYSFRVQAVGSAGKGPYSDPVVKYAP